MTGLGPDIGQTEIFQLAQNPQGIAELLTRDHPSTGESPAEIMADIINVQRADNKMLAAQHGVDLEIKRMTPERAAELLAGTINGDGVEMVVVFNELSEQRDAVLREALGKEEYERFMAQKHAMMFTDPE